MGLLALLASLLYNYVPCDGGKCAEVGTSTTEDPAVTCETTQVCVATLSGGKITFGTVQDSAYDGSIGQQEKKDNDIVCHYACKASGQAAMANHATQFDLDTCKAITSSATDSASDSVSDSASGSGSGSGSDLASMIHAISIVIPLANLHLSSLSSLSSLITCTTFQ